jgi:hypothetical protein
METFELNDRVGSLPGKKPAFTGKVTGIFVGFLQVQYDKPVNNSMSTLIKPNGLQLIYRAPPRFVSTLPWPVTAGASAIIPQPTVAPGKKIEVLEPQPEGVKDGANEEEKPPE